MNNKLTLRSMFVVVMAIAGLLGLVRGVGLGPLGIAISVSLTALGLSLALYTITFLVFAPLAHAARRIEEKLEPGTSPFATDRMPTRVADGSGEGVAS